MIDVGSTSTMTYTVPEQRTVPHLYPEAALFGEMPKVFATGYLVGLLEWACMQHLSEAGHVGDDEISVGTHINVSHVAATVPGQVVTVEVTCTKVEGRVVEWDVTARDERDVITTGTHQRAVLNRGRFTGGVERKAEELGLAWG
ncbi:thioesterase family protein [Propionibacteriaceae bacterium Y1923]|uniref:thioesterase family protein n=1 Tax=Aestuariimicrobium sp. Y1814 TaxID=3418742 RepID=UPI003C245EA0